MKLNELLKDVEYQQIEGNIDIEISSLCFDSREAKNGALFFALKGESTDGHSYIPNVIKEGVKAIVCEVIPEKLVSGITYIQVESSHKAMGLAAATFYNYPSKKLKLIGITGTNGKTTTATLLYRLFQKLGHKSGLISTIAIYINDEKQETTHTTPDSLELNKTLHKMVLRDCEYCFMEVSSHSIVQERIAGLNFVGGAFSNITHDHLDYHKTFEEYIKAKKKFFDNLPSTAFALVNIDDRNGRVMVQNTKATVKTFALKSMADFKCKIMEHSFSGMQLNIDGYEVWLEFVGRFNAYNILMVYAIATLLGKEAVDILTQLSAMGPVSGRFDSVTLDTGVIAVIDYAHTPDALLNVLETINEARSKDSTLYTVVGCGGNRDKTKRPEMARIAVESSNKLILTSDNPRFEEPQDILNDMQAGLTQAQFRETLIIADRKEAIKTALALAKKGDIVLIAGKGHETYQDVKGVKHHFDDKETAIELSKA